MFPMGKRGPKAKPKDELHQRVQISLSPSAHNLGKSIAESVGLSFSAFVESLILEAAKEISGGDEATTQVAN